MQIAAMNCGGRFWKVGENPECRRPILGPAFQRLQVIIPVASEVDRCLGVWGSYAGHQWRPEPGLGPLCALRKAQGVLTLADVWVPNIKDNGGREGR